MEFFKKHCFLYIFLSFLFLGNISYVFSQAAFPSILVQVISPSGGETWYQGKTYTIKWQVYNLPQNLDAYIKIYLVEARTHRTIDIFPNENISPYSVSEKTFFVSDNISPGAYRIRVSLVVPGGRTYNSASLRPFSIEKKLDPNNFDVFLILNSPQSYYLKAGAGESSFLAGRTMRINFHLYGFNLAQRNRLRGKIYLVDEFNLRTEIKDFSKFSSHIYYYDWRIPNDIRKGYYRIELALNLDGFEIFGVSDSIFINSQNSTLPDNIASLLRSIDNNPVEDIDLQFSSQTFFSPTPMMTNKVYSLTLAAPSDNSNALVDIIFSSDTGREYVIASKVYLGSNYYLWKVPENFPLDSGFILLVNSANPFRILKTIAYVQIQGSNYLIFSGDITYPSSTDANKASSEEINLGKFVISAPRHKNVTINSLTFNYSNLSNRDLNYFYNFSLWLEPEREKGELFQVGNVIPNIDYNRNIQFSNLNLNVASNTSVYLILKGRIRQTALVDTLHQFSPASFRASTLIQGKLGKSQRVRIIDTSITPTVITPTPTPTTSDTVETTDKETPTSLPIPLSQQFSWKGLNFYAITSTFANVSSYGRWTIETSTLALGREISVLRQSDIGNVDRNLGYLHFRAINVSSTYENINDYFVSAIVRFEQGREAGVCGRMDRNGNGYCLTLGWGGGNLANFSLYANNDQNPEYLGETNLPIDIEHNVDYVLILGFVGNKIIGSAFPKPSAMDIANYWDSDQFYSLLNSVPKIVVTDNRYTNGYPGIYTYGSNVIFLNFYVDILNSSKVNKLASINITSPSASTYVRWLKNATYTVSWVSSGMLNTDNVSIILFAADNSKAYFLKANTINDGAESVFVNSLVSEGRYYLYVLSSLKVNNMNFAVSSLGVPILVTSSMPETTLQYQRQTIRWGNYEFAIVPATIGDVTRYGQWSVNRINDNIQLLRQSQIDDFHYRILTPITSTLTTIRNNIIISAQVKILDGKETGICGFIDDGGNGYCLTLGWADEDKYTFSLYSNDDQNPSHIGPVSRFIEIATNTDYFLKLIFVNDILIGEVSNLKSAGQFIFLKGVSMPSFAGLYTYGSNVEFKSFNYYRPNLPLSDFISISILDPNTSTIWYKNATQTVRWTSMSQLGRDELLELSLDPSDNSDRSSIILANSTPNDYFEYVFIPESIPNGRYRLAIKLLAKVLNSDDYQPIYTFRSSEFIVTSTQTQTFTGFSQQSANILNVINALQILLEYLQYKLR